MILFVLASASPARFATLQAAGLDPDVVVSGVDESAVEAADAATLVARLAFAKASAVARTRPDALVLGCDSLLELDGSTVGKPASAEDAVAQWKAMRGRTAVLYTGHVLAYGDRTLTEVVGTTVHFADPDDTEIAAYIGTGEPLVRRCRGRRSPQRGRRLASRTAPYGARAWSIAGRPRLAPALAAGSGRRCGTAVPGGRSARPSMCRLRHRRLPRRAARMP
jgi:septum formation protein